ncbi:MAG: PLP-dependent aminotransferase family protein [Acidiphilium sp.]|nr:PLP-dependent aminotransferase family protein [Acidiphilium sp.]MDD4936201.1 PLP-dependent aminotransferase family protein [Acidiphilium sp.]
MPALSFALDPRSRSQFPIQQQIIETLRGLILNGTLPLGSKLPATRVLSERLGVSRGTIVIAYHRLIAEGYLETQSTASTAVSRTLPNTFIEMGRNNPVKSLFEDEIFGIRDPADAIAFEAQAPRLFDPLQDELLYDFRMGRVEKTFFPVKAWRRLVVECLGGAEYPLSQYGDPAGYWPLRTAICTHLLSARGIRCAPEQVIIVAGCQEGLNVMARLLVAPGTPVAIEDPCYQGAAGVFESHNARLVAIPVDEDGLDIERLVASDAKLVYATPSHQFPLGSTMSLKRRRSLIQWALDSGGYVIEDDYDSDFRYDHSPLPAVKALDTAERVIYLGTFSKSIGAGLRLGYAVVPPQLVRGATAAKALANNGHPWLEQAIMAAFIRSGGFEKHLRLIRKCYLARRDCLIGQLYRQIGQHCVIKGIDAGMHLSLRVPSMGMSAYHLQKCLRPVGVGIYSLRDSPARQFTRFAHDDDIIFFGYACLSESRIEMAVSRIARILGVTPVPIVPDRP